MTAKDTVLGKRYAASLKEVVTGRYDAHRVEIVSGLMTDDKVIVSWDRAIEDGAVVDIATGQKP